MKTKTDTPFFTVKRGTLPTASTVKYPFRAMEVGQYFDVPRALDHQVRVRASKHGKKYGRTYSVRRIENERVRVYRTA